MNSLQDLDHFEKKNSTPFGTLVAFNKFEDKPKKSPPRQETKKKSTIRPKSAMKKPANSQNILEMEIQDLDDFFSKFIDGILKQKNQTKTMERIHEEYGEIMKDEDFDKKEFDFSKKMLRLKRKYPLPRFNDEQYPGETLNRIKEHTEMTNQAFNINMASGVSNYIQQQKDAQKEMEKEQIAQNIYQSTIILQNKTEDEPMQKPQPISDGKNKLQTILFQKKKVFSLKHVTQDLKRPTAERIESFSKLDILENNIMENKKKQQEKMAQHHKDLFLNLVDSYERELEIIDKKFANASKTTVTREQPPSSSDRSYINGIRTKSFQKTDKLKFVKQNFDLANSTNLLSLKIQAAKQKNVGFADLINIKMKGSSAGLKEKKKERSPTNRTKNRFQISFDYAKIVESTML